MSHTQLVLAFTPPSSCPFDCENELQRNLPKNSHVVDGECNLPCSFHLAFGSGPIVTSIFAGTKKTVLRKIAYRTFVLLLAKVFDRTLVQIVAQNARG